MRIKGVKTGKERGEPIELTPEEKLREAIKMSCAEETHFPGYLVWLEDYTKKSLNYSSSGALLRGKFANNQYRASGEATLCFRNIAKDQVEPSKKYTFEIRFEDTLDGWGMPDLKVITSSFS